MDELARWYDAEIVYESSDLQGFRFHIYMDRTKTLEEALQVISKIGDITYEIEGKKKLLKSDKKTRDVGPSLVCIKSLYISTVTLNIQSYEKTAKYQERNLKKFRCEKFKMVGTATFTSR